jgi:hypothetical protein
MNTPPAPLPTYQIDADARLGPAMAALTDKQRQFVLALIQSGCSQSKAAELAGYAGGPDTWKAMGWRLAHDARVQAAIHEEAQKLIRTTAVMAIGVIEGLASNPKVKPEVRLKAATELLNRSGLHAHTEHKVTVERPDMDERQLVRRIALLAKEQGLDPVKLLGHRGYVIDAEYELIEGPRAEPLKLSAAGLEDLLE